MQICLELAKSFYMKYMHFLFPLILLVFSASTLNAQKSANKSMGS